MRRALDFAQRDELLQVISHPQPGRDDNHLRRLPTREMGGQIPKCVITAAFGIRLGSTAIVLAMTPIV